MTISSLFSVAVVSSSSDNNSQTTANLLFSNGSFVGTSELLERAVNALRSPQFWMGAAALALIGDPQWLELSERWRSLKSRESCDPDSLCENHEDGKTLSQLHCRICALDLCRECFRVLHLSRKTSGHVAQLIGSAANLCPQVGELFK